MRKLRVFLCHSSGDKPAVRNLYDRMCDENIEPWLDEENLLPGQDWSEEIRKAIKTIDIVIVCMSKDAITKTGFVQKEIKFALDIAEEQPEGTIFIIPVKLEVCDIPERLRRWHYVNLYEEKGYERLMKALKHRANTLHLIVPGKTGIKQQGVEKEKTKPLLSEKIKLEGENVAPRKLRSQPIENLTVDAVEFIRKDKEFFDSVLNKSVPGFPNNYEFQKNGQVVYDHANGLMWQQSGSKDSMRYANAKEYIQKINTAKFSGYNDWRLPTLEEAMSLIKPTKNKDGFYIDPLFDKRQQWIWTSDTYSAARAWVVNYFYGGGCDLNDFDDYYYVRAVR